MMMNKQPSPSEAPQGQAPTFWKLEAITPVHIGDGKTLLHNLDWFYHPALKGQILLTNPRNVLRHIGEKVDVERLMEEWTSILAKKGSILTHQEVENIDPKQYSLRVISLQDDLGKSELKACIHSPLGRALLPGTSLKGAIRSALLRHFLDVEAGSSDRLRPKVQWKGGKKVRNASTVCMNVLGDPGKFETLVTKYISVGDGQFGPNATDCNRVHVHNLINFRHGDGKWVGAPGQRITSASHFAEVIRPGEWTVVRVHFFEQLQYLIDTSFSGLREVITRVPGESGLLAILKAHASQVIENEIVFWEDGQGADMPADVLNGWYELQAISAELAENEALIQVGAGAGYFGITGDWQYKHLRGARFQELTDRLKKYNDQPIFPKTRRASKGGMPFGFLKISITDREMWEQYS